MKSIRRSAVLMAGMLGLGGWTPGVWGKTIAVDFHDAAVFVSPGKHWASTALFEARSSTHPVSVAVPQEVDWAWRRSNSTPSYTNLGSINALSELDHRSRQPPYGTGVPAIAAEISSLAPTKQSDLGAMLTLGALLIAHRLSRKHRTLKQSLIAGSWH